MAAWRDLQLSFPSAHASASAMPQRRGSRVRIQQAYSLFRALGLLKLVDLGVAVQEQLRPSELNLEPIPSAK